MPTLQKKTSDLLKQQKASYPKMVKSALKGKTGLSRAEVNKTIRGVAKDYREQYGSTPRKRYLNAVHAAASTMPKATKTAGTRPSSGAPKAKATPKPKVPKAAPKTEGEKYVQRIQRRNERIRQRTEAAFANHKVEQARKAAQTKATKTKLTKDEIEKLELLRTYVVYPLSLNSEMYEYYYYEDKHDEKVAKYVTSPAIKDALYQLIDKSSGFSAYAKQNFKQMIEKTLSKKAKEPKPQRTWKVGTYLQSPPPYRLFRIKEADLMPLKSPYYRYTLLNIVEGGTITLDDKPEKIQGWRYLTPKEAMKMRKHARAVAQRDAENERKYEEKRKQDLEKTDIKAKYLTANETFIKQFASDLGLSTATIKAMYKVCNDYRHDNLRPVMCGLYCSPEGYLVATDAHILVAIKCKIPAKHKDRIYLKSGMLQEGKYPNWEQIMPINWKLEDREVRYYAGVLEHQQRVCKYHKVGTFDITDYKQVGMAGHNKKEPYAIPYKDLGAGLIIPLTKKLDSVFSSLKEKNIPVYGASPEQGIYFMGKNCMATQMPIIYND